MSDFNVKELNEMEFRKLVLNEHKMGNFKGDDHKMQINFLRNKNSIDFVSLKVSNDNGSVIGFCGMDIYKIKNDKVGFIHCLGVPKNFRKLGFSKKILFEIENIAKQKHNDLKYILSVCNPISCKSHTSVGYIITNPGRLSKTGKLMQIRLRKDIK